MRLDKIILDNFLTYEHLEYDISKKPLLVQGLNKTEEDQESNGSGKSGIFSGIEFCITASNSRDVRDKELVMFGEKEARTQLYASCDVRKQTIHIDWKIKVKGSNVLTLNKRAYDGEWENISFSNVNDGKKYILNWFAIEKEDLFNYYIINKSRFKTFFKASNKEKVELINRFSDASIIDGLDKIDNTKLQNEYNDIKSEIDKIDGKIELTDEQILEEKSKDVELENKLLKDSLLDKIQEAKDDIDGFNQEIKEFKQEQQDDEVLLDDANGKLNALNIKVNKAQLLVDNFVGKDFDKLIDDQNKLIDDQEALVDIERVSVSELDNKSLKVNKLIKELNVELSGSITCPSCAHEFVLDCKHGTLDQVKNKLQQATTIESTIKNKEQTHKDKIKDIQEIIDSLDNKIVSISNERDLESKDRQELVNNLNDINSQSILLSKKINKLDSRLLEHKTDIADCKADIKKFDLIIDGFKQEIKNIGSNTSKVNTSALEASLLTLNKKKTNLENNLLQKGDEIYLNNQWANNFKQFRMHLANQSLEAIEFHMNRYLVGMQSDLKVKLEGFKMLANGTFKDEITAKIIRTVERTFSSFSGGEQGRLLFAAILANRHMINQTHPYGGLDFLSIDEVFEGVDSLGLKKLVQSAKKLNVAVMIITHVTDEEVNDDILLIEKINGISYVKK
jgi:exonuclease SbcC